MNKYDTNIIDVLDEYIQKLAATKWKEDSCPPIFWLSLDNDIEEQHKIILTINHLGSKFSEVLFPRTDAHYGYNSILHHMEQLYNRTM